MSDVREQSTSSRPEPPAGSVDVVRSLKIVILGLMGAGKTAVGEELARLLGLPFNDNDRTLAGATGMTAREIQEESAVPFLHKLEAHHLLDALGSPEPSVVGAAASVVETKRCRAALRATNVFGIWLRAKPETLVARFSNEQHRPTFGDPVVFFRDQIAVRSPHFRELSAAIIDVDGLSIAEAVAAAEASVRAQLARPSNAAHVTDPRRSASPDGLADRSAPTSGP
jgi:shikimate kinase